MPRFSVLLLDGLKNFERKVRYARLPSFRRFINSTWSTKLFCVVVDKVLVHSAWISVDWEWLCFCTCYSQVAESRAEFENNNFTEQFRACLYGEELSPPYRSTPGDRIFIHFFMNISDRLHEKARGWLVGRATLGGGSLVLKVV